MVSDLEIAKKIIKVQQSAQGRGLDFNLTFSEVKKLLNAKRCYYTATTLNDTEKDPNQRTFDRVDNTKGYINGNVVACSKEFNQIKNNLTIEQIKQMVAGFKKKKLWK